MKSGAKSRCGCAIHAVTKLLEQNSLRDKGYTTDWECPSSRTASFLQSNSCDMPLYEVESKENHLRSWRKWHFCKFINSYQDCQ